MNGWIGQLGHNLVARLPDGAQERVTRYALHLVSTHGLRSVPVTAWQGQARESGHIGRLVVAGDDPWVQYLPQRFFCGEVERKSLGQVPVRSLPRFLGRVQESADLTIARVDRLTGQRIFLRDYLVVPEWVGMRMTVPNDVGALVASSSNIQRDVRRIRQRRYRPVVSMGDRDFELFYERFYLPLSKARYQELLVVRSADDLRRRVRRGGILWNQCEGRTVSALLFEEKESSLDVLAVGVQEGDLALVKGGAIAALYYFIIDMANKGGHRTIDFRGNRPSLNDGVLRYKSKWGATLYDKADSYHDLFVRWGRATEVVKGFLSHTPLIFREEGGFSALIGNAPPNEHELWVGGLRRWYRLTEDGYHQLPAAERSLSRRTEGPMG